MSTTTDAATPAKRPSQRDRNGRPHAILTTPRIRIAEALNQRIVEARLAVVEAETDADDAARRLDAKRTRLQAVEREVAAARSMLLGEDE